VAIIVGAAFSPGIYVVRQLASRGVDLAICATVVLKARARKAEHLGVRARPFAMLRHQPDSVRPISAEVLAHFGRVDALVHLAADDLRPGTFGADLCTEAVLDEIPGMRAVVYVFRAPSEQPEAWAEALERRGLVSAAIACAESDKAAAIAARVWQACAAIGPV